MNLLSYAFPILASMVVIGLIFLPALLIIAFLPKRLPALRHAVLAATFAGILAWVGAKPLMDAYSRSHPAAGPTVARQVRAEAAQPVTPHPISSTATFRLPESFRPRWDVSDMFYRYGQYVCFGWFGVSYLLTLLLLLRSKPSQRRAGFRISRDVRVPVTLWAFRHFIVMPLEAEGWPDDRLDRVIAHERAHISRGDWFWQAIANFVTAYTVMNPFSWLCLRKLRNLAERAADQQVLLQSAPATDYATDLLEIAKSARRPANCAALAIATPGSLRGRVQAILSDVRPRRTSKLGLACSATLALAAMTGFGILVIPASAHVLSGITPGQGGGNTTYPQSGSSFYADIRNGLTTAGSAMNTWTARFSNGIEPRLLGVFYGGEQGAEFRGLNGFISQAPTKASKYVTGHPGHLELIFAVPANRIDESVNIGIGSSSYTDFHKEPSSLEFAGGYSSLSPDKKTLYVHGFLGLRNPHSGESYNEQGKLVGHGPLATQISVSLAYSDKQNEVKAVPLASLLKGQSFAVNDGIISLAHRTNAEKQCFKEIGLASDAFGIRLEVPRNSMTQYEADLSDNPNDLAGIHPAQGCGGQEDATPGYHALQEWFRKESKAKKYAIVKGSRMYAVDFIAIPLVK